MNLLDNMGFVVDKSQLSGRKNRNYLVGSMYLWLIQFMGWCRPSKLRILARNATLLILVCWNLDDHQTQSMLVSAVSVVDICDFTAVQPVALGARLWAKLIILSALGKSGHFNKWYRNRSKEHFIQRNVVFIILDALHGQLIPCCNLVHNQLHHRRNNVCAFQIVSNLTDCNNKSTIVHFNNIDTDHCKQSTSSSLAN